MIAEQQRFSLSPTYYPKEYKQMVCEHYLRGNKTKEEIRKDFGIKGKSSLLYWLRQLGYSEPRSKTELPFMAKSKKETTTGLEKENEDLKLLLEMYKRMIAIAEKEFKISIVKKSDTK